MKTTQRLSLAVATSLIVASGFQLAAAADKKIAAPRAKAASAVMSKEELRQCLDQKESVRVESESIGKDRASLASGKAALEKRGNELTDRLVVLDRTSASAVDAHNADVVEREKAVDAFQAQVEAFNTKVITVRDHQQAFEKACGTKLYEVKDENALRRGK